MNTLDWTAVNIDDNDLDFFTGRNEIIDAVTHIVL